LGVDRARLASALPKDCLLLIDTSVLIAYLNAGEEISEVATLLIDQWVRTGRNRAVISAISAMEMLVGPLRANEPLDDYLDFIQRFPHLDCVPADVAVAKQAAMVRARHGVRPPDALIIGTAVAVGADAIVTNDARWTIASPKPTVVLSDYV
jgi:predicted nucleic acid-binding protein